MGTEGALDGQSFSGTNTGNVLADGRSDTLYSNRCKIQENGNHRFWHALDQKIKKRLKK
jgi:hypothetical protein